MGAHSRLMSITLAAMVAAGVTVAAQTSGGKDSEKKSDGVVTDTAKATGKATADGAKATGKKTAEVAKATGSTTKKGAKATAGGAKRLGLGIRDAVTPGNDDKPKDKEKKK
jgi:hypothetical protein